VFLERSPFRLGGLAVGDFNGDGIPDLVVTDRRSNSFSLLLGKGTGSFVDAAPVSVPVMGTGPTVVQAADFNGDGTLDVAILDEGSHTVEVFLGDGHGVFTPRDSISLGEVIQFDGSGRRSTLFFSTDPGLTPTGLLVADFNGDGRLDLVVGTQSGDILTLFGIGDGTFRGPILPTIISPVVTSTSVPVSSTPAQVQSNIGPNLFAPSPEIQLSGPLSTTSESGNTGGELSVLAGSKLPNIPINQSTGFDVISGQRTEVLPDTILFPTVELGSPGGDNLLSGVDLVGSLLTGGNLRTNLLPQKGASMAPVATVIPGDVGDGRAAKTLLSQDDELAWPSFVIGLDDTIHRRASLPQDNPADQSSGPTLPKEKGALLHVTREGLPSDTRFNPLQQLGGMEFNAIWPFSYSSKSTSSELPAFFVDPAEKVAEPAGLQESRLEMPPSEGIKDLAATLLTALFATGVYQPFGTGRWVEVQASRKNTIGLPSRED
jgi:hypothetical protein